MGLIRMMAALGLVLVFAIAACERASATNTTAAGAEADSVDSIAPAEVQNACVKTFNETMANPNAFLVDVRSADEFNKAHIPGRSSSAATSFSSLFPRTRPRPFCSTATAAGGARRQQTQWSGWGTQTFSTWSQASRGGRPRECPLLECLFVF